MALGLFFIDKSGKYIIEPQFDLAGDFAEGLAAAEIGKKWGYIDTNGSFAIR
jgi:hypothetical protein